MCSGPSWPPLQGVLVNDAPVSGELTNNMRIILDFKKDYRTL